MSDLDFDLIPEPKPVPDCIHELPRDQCDFCKPRPQRQERNRSPITIRAKFDGRCYASCGEPIEVGQDIAYSEDHNGYVHVECAS